MPEWLELFLLFGAIPFAPAVLFIIAECAGWTAQPDVDEDMRP